MLSKRNKEKLVNALIEMESLGKTISIHSKSIKPNDISNESREIESFKFLYNENKLCLFDNANYTSIELPFNRIEDLYINKDICKYDGNYYEDSSEDEIEIEIEIHIAFLKSKVRYDISNYL